MHYKVSNISVPLRRWMSSVSSSVPVYHSEQTHTAQLSYRQLSSIMGRRAWERAFPCLTLFTQYTNNTVHLHTQAERNRDCNPDNHKSYTSTVCIRTSFSKKPSLLRSHLLLMTSIWYWTVCVLNRLLPIPLSWEIHARSSSTDTRSSRCLSSASKISPKRAWALPMVDDFEPGPRRQPQKLMVTDVLTFSTQNKGHQTKLCVDWVTLRDNYLSSVKMMHKREIEEMLLRLARTVCGVTRGNFSHVIYFVSIMKFSKKILQSLSWIFSNFGFLNAEIICMALHAEMLKYVKY